jgi:methylmalonyl-CoA mutase N-terminal domain/subunit
MGGTNSLHTNSMDEALALPSEKAARLALRTQQVIAHESGVANTVDPLGGSYFVEALTNETEADAYRYFHKIEDMGGVIPAIENGYLQREIADASFDYQRRIDKNEYVVVGVNDYVMDEPIEIPILEMDPQGEQRQVDRLNDLRRSRDSREATRTLKALEAACRNGDNVMPYLLDAVNAYCTLQEMCDVMRDVFGVYQEAPVV